MKKLGVMLIPILVNTAGAVVVSQAVSFGWYYEGAKVGFILRDHAAVLFATGVGLIAAGSFIRHSSARISALEEKVALLQKRE
jgi:hypothetical protein